MPEKRNIHIFGLYELKQLNAGRLLFNRLHCSRYINKVSEVKKHFLSLDISFSALIWLFW